MSNLLITYPSKFYPIVKKSARYKVAKGGRGSAKSESFARLSIKRSLTEKGLRFLCCRELQNSLRESVHKTIVDTIELLSVEHDINLSSRFKITDRYIKSSTGCEYIFAGLRNNYNEIKSIKGINVAWIEEAEGISQDSIEVLDPTVRTPNSELWVSFNPETRESPCNKTFVEEVDPSDSVVVEMNWRDNPWFPEVLRKRMEWCKKTDYDKFLWIWEGQYKNYAEDVIFKDKIEIIDFDYPGDNQQYYIGMDFGFSVDPTAIVQCFIRDKNLYIEHDFYGHGVEIEELPNALNSLPAVRRGFSIKADSSRPDTISFLSNRGFNIEGAEKHAGSVEEGINFLRSFGKIYIHSRCKGTIEDFQNYRFKRDRITQEILPIPLDKSNHSCDAARYSLSSYIKGSVSIYDVL